MCVSLHLCMWENIAMIILELSFLDLGTCLHDHENTTKKMKSDSI